MDKNRKDATPSNIKFSADWDDDEGRAGVDVGPSGLVWWYHPNGPGGHLSEVGAQQTFEEFRVQGPMGVPVPEK